MNHAHGAKVIRSLKMDGDVLLCETVLGELERGIQIIRSSLPIASLEAWEDLIEGAELLLQISVLVEPLLPDQYQSAITREIQHIVQLTVAEYEDMSLDIVTRGHGRPPLDIQESQLLFLLENSFSVTDIAGMFNCSRRTIQRRMITYGLESCRFTDINDVHFG